MIQQFNTDLSIKPHGIPNRINSEINNLFNQCDYVSAERNKDKTIKIIVIKDKNKFEILLSDDYPFRPPKNILYNDINYKHSLSNAPKTIQDILKNKYHINCLCCDTIICGNNWMPAMNTSHVINEIIKLSNIKKEIKIILLCDIVRNKGKCYFAEFEKYLF